MNTPYKKDIIDAASLGFIPFERLSGKRILVTGATGLIGGAVADLLEYACPQCHLTLTGRSIKRLEARFPDTHAELIELDLSKEKPHQGYDFIIHAAGYANPALYAAYPAEVMTLNYNSTLALLENVRANSESRLLYVSSDEVYGESQARVISESDSGYVDCTRPRSCYPSSKRHCETLCAAYCAEYGTDIVIARPSHVYGPFFTEGDNRVYAQFMRNAIAGEDIVLKSQGDQMRSWCYAPDCASALLTVLLKGATSQAYNIADNSSAFTIRDLAGMTAFAAGTRVRQELPPEEEKRGYNPVRRSVLSTEKLENLGWRPIQGTPQEKIASTIKTRQLFYGTA